MSKIKLQPVDMPDGRRPYPFLVDEHNDEGLEGNRLVGFQVGDVQTIVLHIEEWRKEPGRAVGLVPVFAAVGGKLYAQQPPIGSVTA